MRGGNWGEGAGQGAGAGPALWPRPLGAGDRIGIPAPAGRVHPDAFERGLRLVSEWGFVPVPGRHVYDGHGYLAGTDAGRAADLNRFLRDPGIRAIWCARGGYGAMRLLPLLDLGALRQDPKPLVGYSDITALHLAAWQAARVITYHGPTVEVGEGGMPDYNARCLLDALTDRPAPGPYPLPAEPDAPALVTIVPGRARGPLLGGNLSLVSHLVGTPWLPDLRGAILLLEDVDEAPYRVDRMLTHLRLAGALDGVAGILFGDSPTCMEPKEPKPSLSLLEVLHEVLGLLGVPVLYGFPCGHGRYRATLPLGAEVELDAGAGLLSLG